MIEKDLEDHTALAADIVARFGADPGWWDVVVLVEGEKFHSYKGILVAVSPYFRQLFTNDFRDEKEIRLEGFTKIGFRPVWDYIHGTRLEVEGEEGALAALQDASFLGLRRLSAKLSGVVEAMLSAENAFRVLAVAEQCKCDRLREAAVGHVSVRFHEAAHTEAFLGVSFRTLTSFLGRNELGVASEKEVYEAARKWVERDGNRLRHLPDILEMIRLPLLPQDYLKTVVLADPAIRADPRCLDAVVRAMVGGAPEVGEPVAVETKEGQSEEVQESVDLPSYSDAAMEFWCVGEKSKQKQIYRIHPNDNWSLESVSFYPFPGDESFCRALAAVGRKLYVVGRGVTKTFDLDERKWETGPRPSKYLKWPASAASPGSVYVCGGRDQANAYQRFASRLDVETGQWMRLSEMRFPRNGAGATYADSCLHVVGGSVGAINHVFRTSRKYERLDLRTSKWEELAELPHGRESPGVACDSGDLLLSGGWDGKSTKDVFVYDARQNAWLRRRSMAKGRYRHGLLDWDGRLHALGGKSRATVEVLGGSDESNVIMRYELPTLERPCPIVR